MGCFSWCTSDTRKSIPCCIPFGDLPGTVYLLNPFGEPYKETEYDGYGEFGGRDVYELVVEWNRKYLTEDSISLPERRNYGSLGAFRRALDEHAAICEAIQAYAGGATDDFMEVQYGKLLGYAGPSNWKRSLGIKIACNYENHVKLKYPIKIVERPEAYENAGISAKCPFQGYFYPESRSLKAIQLGVDRAFERLTEEEEKWKASLDKKPLDSQIQDAEKSKDNLRSHGKEQGLGERYIQ